MRWQDLPVAVAATAALAALIAVSWRASPDRNDTLFILYVIAGVLEVAGALAVGYDLNARRRRTRDYTAKTRKIDIVGKAAIELIWSADVEVSSGHVPSLEERVHALEEHKRGERDRILAVVNPVRDAIQQQIRQTEETLDNAAAKRD